MNLKRMTRSFFCQAIVLIISIASLNAETIFFKTKAQEGDGIYSILRRYQLLDYTCNFEQFYVLNKLKRNAKLIVGREYFLPIMVYDFDGKSIRSTINIKDWNLAVSIRDYNKEMVAQKLKEDAYEKSKILWVPYHQLNCPDELTAKEEEENEKEEETIEDKNLGLPPKVSEAELARARRSGRRIFPIFGPDFEYTPLKSDKLKGKVFYIVGGHGGPDPGAIGKRGGRRLCEDEYAYDVALRLCRNLISHGATAYMINRDNNDGIRTDEILKCDTDEQLWGDIRMVRHHKTRLFQRSDVINELHKKHGYQGVTDQKAVMIHVDSRQTRERTDVYFYYHPDSEDSGTVAKQLQKKMKEKYKQVQKNRTYYGTVTERDLHMLREIKPLAVYVELGNISNPVDQQRIVLPRNRQLIADWLFAGIDSVEF